MIYSILLKEKKTHKNPKQSQTRNPKANTLHSSGKVTLVPPLELHDRKGMIKTKQAIKPNPRNPPNNKEAANSCCRFLKSSLSVFSWLRHLFPLTDRCYSYLFFYLSPAEKLEILFFFILAFPDFLQTLVFSDNLLTSLIR